MNTILSTFETGNLLHSSDQAASAGADSSDLPANATQEVLRTLTDWSVGAQQGLVGVRKNFYCKSMDEAREFHSQCVQSLSNSTLSVRITQFADQPKVAVNLVLKPSLSAAHLAVELIYNCNRLYESYRS